MNKASLGTNNEILSSGSFQYPTLRIILFLHFLSDDYWKIENFKKILNLKYKYIYI